MSDLTDRYVTAVLRAVPNRQLADIEAELRASIADDVEARMASGLSEEAAERAVLTELGEPHALAATYLGRPLALIGPKVYLAWWQTVKIVLATSVPIVFAVITIVNLAKGSTVLSSVSAGVGTAIQVGVWVFAGLTIAWALVDRMRDATAAIETASAAWTPDLLPAARSKATIPFVESLFTIAWFAVTIAVLVGVLSVHEVTLDPAHGPVELFHPVFVSWVPVLIGLGVAAILLELVKLRVARWTWPLALANTVLTLAAMGLVAWLFLTGQVIGQSVIEQPDGAKIFGPYGIVAWSVAPVVVVAALWGSIDSWVKALRGDSRSLWPTVAPLPKL